MRPQGLLLAFFLLIFPQAFAQQRYTVTDIGPLGGGPFGGIVKGMNSQGEVVGLLDTVQGSYYEPVFHGFYWSKATGILDLGTPFQTSEAGGINGSGVVVGGRFEDASGDELGFR